MRIAGIIMLLGMIAWVPTRANDRCDRKPFPDLPFSTSRLSEHVKVMASDAFEGRAPASAGESKTIAYLSSQFSALGLKPAGDQGGWTQVVRLRKFEWDGKVEATAQNVGVSAPLQLGDALALSSQAGVANVELSGLPVIFVGYGVDAPELEWDDFKGVDLAGKVAVFLINDPDFSAESPGKFGGKAMTYYGRWSYKFEIAARRGAAAALIVHEDAPASYGWATVRNSWGLPQFDIVRDNPRQVHPLVEGWIHRDAALRLFQQAGLDFEQLKVQAVRSDFQPVLLKATTLSLQGRVRSTDVLSSNVVAKQVGRIRPNESLIYTAHWDHLGIGEPDGTGDRIYHGAVDNALGVAGLLELARVFATQTRTERSLYFVAVTGEEKGLLGSQHFVMQPPAPLEQTAAVFNLDILGTEGPTCDLSLRGVANSTLHEIVTDAARKQGRVVLPDAHPEAGYFYRSDHFPFAKRGVPAVTSLPGIDLYVGGVSAGERAYREYISQRYHQPADRWSASWDLRGAALDLGVLYASGRSLANSSTWPQWYTGSEFKHVRDRSKDARR